MPVSDPYESNKTIMNWVRDGFLLKRENHKLQDIENYYSMVAESGANEYQVDESKR